MKNSKEKKQNTDRFWDEEKSMKKPAITTSDIPNPADVEDKEKRAEISRDRKKQSSTKKEKTLETRCPFDKDLACEGCRLYQPYEGGSGDKACVFIRLG